MMDNPSSVRLLKLVKALLKRTQEGSIDWDETDDDFVYHCDTPRAAVQIESIDRDDSGPYRIVILNSSGREIESLVSHAAGLDSLDKADFLDLYRLAKRRALGTDEVISDLFDELGIDESEVDE